MLVIGLGILIAGTLCCRSGNYCPLSQLLVYHIMVCQPWYMAIPCLLCQTVAYICTLQCFCADTSLKDKKRCIAGSSPVISKSVVSMVWSSNAWAAYPLPDYSSVFQHYVPCQLSILSPCYLTRDALLGS